jgi:hypothetical protein
MSVQLTIPYETLVELIDQLEIDKQFDLLLHLQQQAQKRPLTSEEWKTLFDSIKIDIPLAENISLNRADWYDDEEL